VRKLLKRAEAADEEKKRINVMVGIAGGTNCPKSYSDGKRG
jgi:hypothetical protein